jgi:hypothetical protein
MSERERQLKERDVRKEAPDLDPGYFLQAYIRSNFPQTAVMPSPEQKAQGMVVPPSNNLLQLSKEPLKGTSYDNPGKS